MSTNRHALFARLHELGISTTTVEHAPMFTVEQSASLRNKLPGAHTKSLFLTDKDGHRVLVVAKDDTRVDLKALAKRVCAGRFSFAKGELLEAVTRCSSRFGYAVGADPSGGGGRDRRGRRGTAGLCRGKLPSAREHRDHVAGDARPHPLHRGLRAFSPHPPARLR
jgi:prolyl-tRNA editing enzyme YbaK/EbsC (Cys-tRNA(Pro) deacylase)